MDPGPPGRTHLRRNPHPQPKKLRQLDSHIVDRTRCPGTGGELPTSQELCVASLPGNPWPQTSRAGDSGGPLLAKHKGKWTVLGAVSRGANMNEHNTVYTSTHAHLKWITDTMRGTATP
ncbi:trypsin-like serine protease [Streptomyces sp. NPDC004838]